jgi:diaminohydroxyphosphoribosylaminopyrimidine deaminase/5-amino-6-(5-phosphoribosylamino)uracil reductase
MDELYMQRCLDLAVNGLGSVAPNPMVGCVIVRAGRIIGEGYHRAWGEAHAEVNAIASVGDPEQLADSTLYVNLEPCSHLGKTPACSRMILDRKIPRVVVGTADPNPLVAGGGLRMLKEGGVEVRAGVMEGEGMELNKRFFTWHRKKRPWILLKWAKTGDGFLDRPRGKDDRSGVNWITGPDARQCVHKWRSEEQSVLVGTNTALLDDPALTVRQWKGRDPLRLVIDRVGKLPGHLKLFDGTAPTVVFTSKPGPGRDNAECVEVAPGNDYIPAILEYLYARNIQSLMVEGGAGLLNAFIRSGLWDEARVFTGTAYFKEGVPAPVLPSVPSHRITLGEDLLEIFRNT